METKQIINWLRDKADRGPNHSWTRMLNMAADRLDELEQRLFVQRELSERQRWIPVDERLPVLHTDDYEEWDGSRIQFEVSDDQWVITASGYQTKARYETGVVFQGWVEEFGSTVRNVTHWMPLPEPPKEVE